MAELKIVTWNTCGINNTPTFPEKRAMILQTLTEQACVAFLQETHIGDQNTKRIQSIRGWRKFYSVYSSSSKGVAIMIKNDLPFEHIKHDVEPTGSYIVLICKLHGKCFTLVNVYNHTEERGVLRRLSEYLYQAAKGVLIVAGDFNTVLNTDLDREFPTGHTEPLRPYLEEFISSLMLVDVWADRNSSERDLFTRSPWGELKEKGASRIDMVFMPRNALWLVKRCEIRSKQKQNRISDHYPLALHLSLPEVDQAAHNTGDICEAEVLKAISSLIDCENTNGESLEDIKKNKEQKAGELKQRFNRMITKEKIPAGFNESVNTHEWYFFKADYMILATIIVRRLEAFLQPSFETKDISTHENMWVVGFQDIPRLIKKFFLREALSSLNNIYPPPPDFGIIEKLLPNKNDNLELRKGCPLTPTLLTLSLKHLAKDLKKKLKESVVDACHHRKCITIYMKDDQSTLNQMIEEFQNDSGFSLSCRDRKINIREKKKTTEKETEVIPPNNHKGTDSKNDVHDTEIKQKTINTDAKL